MEHHQGIRIADSKNAFRRLPFLVPEEIFSQACQSISNAWIQERGKNAFSHNQSQHTRTPVCGKNFQDTPFSRSRKHFNFVEGRKLKRFSQKLGKTSKRPHNFRSSARLQCPFYCAARAIENSKSSNNITRGKRFDRPEDQRYTEQGCNFSSKESVSELIAFAGKKMAKLFSDQSECFEQSAPLCWLSGQICQVWMKCSVIRIFTSMLRTSFSAKNFHQINESPNIFAAETLDKNYNISRWYALDGSFSRGTNNSSEYIDIST